MQALLHQTLSRVLGVLLGKGNLKIKDRDLFSVSKDEILTPVGDTTPLLLQHKSSLDNQFVDVSFVENFITELNKDGALVRINHAGFCYKASPDKEKQRLLKLLQSSKYNLYQEPSNDEGAWFFIGNNENWKNPMIELIPVEKSDDKWVDYWLPHIQIDVDTTLTEAEIKKYVLSTFGDTVEPFSINIDGIVYIVRNHLGIIDGVNIMLDIATNSRDVQYQRHKLLQKINS